MWQSLLPWLPWAGLSGVRMHLVFRRGNELPSFITRIIERSLFISLSFIGGMFFARKPDLMYTSMASTD
jgi:hypothetical protein